MLFAPVHGRVTYIVDAAGEVVHSWSSETPASGAVALLENGHLVRAARSEGPSAFSGGGMGGRIQEFDWDGKLVWDFAFANERHWQHHFFALTAYGTVLLIAWEHKTAEEALAAGRSPETIPEQGLWSDFVAEIEPQPPNGGVVLWEWHFWDHLIQDRFPERDNFGPVSEHPGRLDVNARPRLADEPKPSDLASLRALGYAGGDPEEEPASRPARRSGGAHPSDWIHTNAIAYDPETDRILLCSRNLSEIWVIDHSTTTIEARGRTGGRRGRGGDFLARWGNPANLAAAEESVLRLIHPHDAHWIPHGRPGQGNVLLFNNGPDPSNGGGSQVLELRIPGITGELAASAARRNEVLVWACTNLDGSPFFSSHFSGAQRLPGGNTLVTVSAGGRIAEVSPDGAVLWEYRHGRRPEDQIDDPAGSVTGSAQADPSRAPEHPAGIPLAVWLPADHPGLSRLGEHAATTNPR